MFCIRFRIRNKQTGEAITISRDVKHVHPTWVHEQCDTQSEGELQRMLDQTNFGDYVKAGCQFQDDSGIFVVIPEGALALKYADSSEGARFLFSRSAIDKAERKDPNRVVRMSVERPRYPPALRVVQ